MWAGIAAMSAILPFMEDMTQRVADAVFAYRFVGCFQYAAVGSIQSCFGLWEVANRLRGNMSASDFMYFTLGFIFYKYLSEKIEKYANSALEDDEVTFKELWDMTDTDAMELQEEVKNQCLENIGYFIEPKYLFSSVIDTIKRKENILPMLERSLKRIEDSTLGQDSEEDFGGLFSDIDLASPKLGKTQRKTYFKFLFLYRQRLSKR